MKTNQAERDILTAAMLRYFHARTKDQRNIIVDEALRRLAGVPVEIYGDHIGPPWSRTLVKRWINNNSRDHRARLAGGDPGFGRGAAGRQAARFRRVACRDTAAAVTIDRLRTREADLEEGK